MNRPVKERAFRPIIRESPEKHCTSLSMRMRKTPATIALLTDEYLEYRQPIVDQMASVLADAGYAIGCITG